MVRSRAHGWREDLAFMLGSDIFRCGYCGARYLFFYRFKITSPRYSYTPTTSTDSFMIVWLAIVTGLLSCIGLAFWTLRKFHRWPF
jgi:hypothetical protein